MPDPIEVGSEAAYCFPTPTKIYADDGSGWAININQTSGIVTAVGPDGTIVNNGSTGVEDTNGNELTATLDTLGRSMSTDGSYYDSNGVLRSIAVSSEHIAVQSHLCPFSTADSCTEYSGTWYVPQIITLPNGMTYTFAYDQGSPTHPYYGQPLSVTVPTGARYPGAGAARTTLALYLSAVSYRATPLHGLTRLEP
jgi:hypothetical protein